MERAMIPAYRALIDRVLGRLSAANAAEATEIVRQYEEIKGYGHVKERNHKAVLAGLEKLLAQYEGTAAPQEKVVLFKKAS
jgi:indolepyruvate ferredoxin oxidoreductase